MIRVMQPADCDAIATIETQIFNTALDSGRLLTLLKMPAFCGFVDDLDYPHTLERSNNLAGYLLATMILDEAEILSIAVKENHQKCGRGSGLLGYFLAHLVGKDVKTTFLEVAADNMSALTFYQSHGFTEFGRRAAYYKRLEGNCDAIMMKRQRD